jgi:hypothetical protein
MSEIKNIIKEGLNAFTLTVNHLIDVAPEIEVNFKDFTMSAEVLKEGTQSNAVKFLQMNLAELGYLSDECISGNFRENTKNALKNAIGADMIPAKHLGFLKDLSQFKENQADLGKDFIWKAIVARGENKKEFEFQEKIFSSETLAFLRTAL